MSNESETASQPLMRKKGGNKENIMLETALTAFFLGSVFVASIVLMVHALWGSGSAPEFALGAYLLVVHVAFHMIEFILSAAQRPHNCHPAAFMLFHSKEYALASLTALLEFAIEACLIPESWKAHGALWWCLGLRLSFASAAVFALLTSLFYGIRVAAMAQCGANFSLMIEDSRRDDHVLVDTGLYRYLRHPAYFGWFWRTLCAQLILANPVSLVVHTGVTWVFFRRRISYEESTLGRTDYFGADYQAYRERTHIGIPLIPTGIPAEKDKAE